MHERVWNILVITVLLILFLYIGYHLAMLNTLFKPSNCSIWEPSSYKELYIDPNTGKLSTKGINCWLITHNVNKPFIIFFHGNAGNNSCREYVDRFFNITEVNLLLVDYQGYGRSYGLYTSQGLINSADKSYKFISSHIPENRIIVMGESIGGYPASYIANKYNPSKLIMLATFTNITDIYREHIGSTGDNLANKLFRFSDYDMDINSNISNTSIPIMIIHSSEDRLIPISCAKRNHEVTKNHSELCIIKGDHTNPVMSSEVMNKLFTFIDSNYRHYPTIDDYLNKSIQYQFSLIAKDILKQLER